MVNFRDSLSYLGGQFVGEGEEEFCQNPELLAKKITKDLKDLVNEIVYESANASFHKLSLNKTENWKTLYKYKHGRCYSLLPSKLILENGIVRILIIGSTYLDIYIHSPNNFLLIRESEELRIELVPKKEIDVKVHHEIFDILHFNGESCERDENYNIEACRERELNEVIDKELLNL